MDFQKFILRVLSTSSEIANRNFGRVKGQTKSGDNNQVLTETDVEIGKFLIGEIEKSFPRHNIIDEEAGGIDKNSKYTWVIDPIDGTSNFANGVAEYGIMVGVLKNDVPIAGGISLPFFSEICVAEKENGAWFGDKRLLVTKEKNLLSSLVAYAIDGHQESPDMTVNECKTLAGIILGCRNLRASGSCYDVVQVAKGNYGGFLNRTSKIWDNVAPQIILEEAGAKFTDFFGKPMDYSRPLTKLGNNFTVCAAAPILHLQLQKIIHR